MSGTSLIVTEEISDSDQKNGMLEYETGGGGWVGVNRLLSHFRPQPYHTELQINNDFYLQQNIFNYNNYETVC